MKDECEKKDRSRYFLYLGKSLNVQSEYDERGFQALSKAVKLNPSLLEGLNQLGESYWKKGQIDLAIECFENTLKQEPKNVVALRSLSMLFRQRTGDDPKEKLDSIMKSHQKAKEALDADINDGMNWYILGNSLFYLYFLSPRQDETRFKQCKFAYMKAANDKKASQQPDFLYNYAHVLEYELNFKQALDCLDKASLYDPDWSDPRERRESIRDYIKNVSSMISNKASLKNRRVTKLIEDLKQDILKRPSALKELEVKNISSLECGTNQNCCIMGKVIGQVSREGLLTSCFCILDLESEVVAVNVINFNKEKEPLLYQTVTIINPELHSETLEFNCEPTHSCVLSMIRVENPISILVNGRPLGNDAVVRPKVDFSLRTD